MNTKLHRYEKIGTLLIIISIIFLLFGNLFEGFWPITEKIFETGIIVFIGFIGILFIVEGRKKKRQIK